MVIALEEANLHNCSVQTESLTSPKALVLPENQWEDFYGFNRNGHWLVSYIVMLAASFIISSILWILLTVRDDIATG